MLVKLVLGASLFMAGATASADASWGVNTSTDVTEGFGTEYNYQNQETGQRTRIFVSEQQNSDGSNLTSGWIENNGVETFYNQAGQETYAKIGEQHYNRCGQEVGSASEAMAACDYDDGSGEVQRIEAIGWAQY
ncbi:MAG: hypothetical protein K2X47_06250 [Bdellovibrionales bacterium]|nr:hypothetical protein [Bdellovibrionales bacterium]